MLTVLAVVLAVVWCGLPGADGPVWALQDGHTSERLRAVSVVDARVAWAGGNRGTVLRTVDGGRTWTRGDPPDAGTLDFRDIEAFDAATAVALSIGPGDQSRIYRTADGGATWALEFTNPDPRAFYDALAFWDSRRGIAVGDPVDGRLAILRTDDGGTTWSATPPGERPAARPGEGLFAASGTCVVTRGRLLGWLATGGANRARVFRTVDGGKTWSASETPAASGGPSAGLFSIAFDDAAHGIAVGGDYRKERDASDNVVRTADGGRSWSLGATRLRGFRSGVVYIPHTGGAILVAVGPSGSDWSADGGDTWTPIGNEGFHAVGVSRRGDAVWAVGEGGRIGRLMNCRGVHP
jgi:photosystem II stability/assembly factor-like uncharacterized protein